MNFLALFHLKKSGKAVLRAHPNISTFGRDLLKAGVKPGDYMEIKFRSTEGKELETNITIRETDLEFVNDLRSLMKAL